MAGTRKTQTAVEVLVQPSTAQLRPTQTAVEVLAAPTTAQVRVSQTAVEVLINTAGGGGTARAYVIIV